MKTTRRLTVAIATGALGFGAFAVGPAIAIDGGHEEKSPEKSAEQKDAAAEYEARKAARAEARKANWKYRVELRKAKRAARAAIRTCSVDPAKLIAVEDNKLLSRLAANFEAKVEAGEWTAEKAEAKLVRYQERLTLRVVMKSAQWGAMLKLFGAENRKDLAKMLREARGLRALMESKEITRVDLKGAKRSGRIARYDAAVYFCNSGVKDEPAEESTGDETATDGEEATKAA